MTFPRNLVLLFALGYSAVAKNVVNIPNSAFIVDVSDVNTFNLTSDVLEGEVRSYGAGATFTISASTITVDLANEKFSY